ncbi:hypothetical protein TIFTF001_055814 [Ficus carica]|uniref:Uncharacterized protein n=1 Tax=Ficus carica TaxID=3494 RepID=A0AA88EH53_FICCA|nr:hypothetical protein TIFTF001_055814 [Ficus carica]
MAGGGCGGGDDLGNGEERVGASIIGDEGRCRR